jgi:hypothetical protein
MLSPRALFLRWLAVCAFVLAFFPHLVLAQAQPAIVWQRVSAIPGQNIICLNAIGGEVPNNTGSIRVFAGTNDGVYRSTNSGASWTRTLGWNKQQVTSFFTASDGTLFATSWGGGVFRSSNDGTSWTASNQGLPPINYEARAMAQCGSRLFVGTSRGLCYSDDNGATWNVTIGVPFDVRSLLVLGSTVFAGTLNNGILRSPDIGVTWEFVNNGLPANARYILSFTVGYQNLSDALAIFAATSTGGVVRSIDNGATWSVLSLTGQTLQCLVSNGDADNEMFVGTKGSGVQRSQNNNPALWSAINQGLDSLDVISIAITGSTLFAGTYDGSVWTTVIAPYSGFARVLKNLDLGETLSSVTGKPQGFTVYGQNIGGNITLTAPKGVEIAVSANGQYGASSTLTTYGGRIDQTVFARLNFPTALTVNDPVRVEGNASFSLNVRGKIVDPTPVLPLLTILPAALNLGSVIQGANTTSQTITVTGANLTAPVTITATTGTLIFNPATLTWSNRLILSPFNGSMTVSIRLDSSLTPRSFAGIITAASGTALANMSVNGSIIAPPEPRLFVSDNKLPFGTIIRGNASPVRTYTLSGANLTAPVLVSAPTGAFLLNPANGQWVSNLTLTPNSTGSLMQTISVRMDSSVVRTLNGGAGASIRHQSANASVDVEVFGTVQDSPSLTVTLAEPLNFGTVRLGSSTAARQYTLTGSNLLEPVVITAPAGVLLFNPANGAWTNSLTLTPNAGSLMQTVRVGIDSSQVRPVNGTILNVSASSLGAIGSTQASVIVTGNIIPLPQLTATPLQPENLDTIIHFDPSRGGVYTLTGSFLDAPVSVSAPQGILLFDQTNKTWTQALTLQPDADGSLMQTVSVRLDSSRLGPVRDSIRNVSGATSASVSVRGTVVPLTLPSGAETTLELRFVGQQPLRLRDTARVQIWLKDSRLLTPRLVGRFLRTLRVTVRIDTNNLAVLDISSLTPRARIESPQRVPANTPLYTILAERPDTISTGNLLLAEMTVLATLGATTTNTIRIADPMQWLGSDGSITPASAVRILREPESVAVQIRPLFLRRSSTIAVVAPNPSSDAMQLLYTLSSENGTDASAVTLTISDAAGRTVKRVELGARQTGVAQQETVRLGDLPTGAYLLMLLTPSETLPCRLDVVR